MRERAVASFKLTVVRLKSQATSPLTSQTSYLEPGWINLLGLMALSDVFCFGVNSILQGSSNPQSLRQSEVDVLFDIPLIGLFKAVRFESYSFHEAILLFKNCGFKPQSRVLAVGRSLF